jgi:MscS family membrane protein
LIGVAVLVASAWAVVAQRSLAETGSPSLKEIVAGSAQQPGSARGQVLETGHPAVPDDKFDRGAPRSMVRRFLEAARARNFDRAAHYLDIQHLPPEAAESGGPQLARQLKLVLDRMLWIDLDLLSASPDGDVNDGLPQGLDRVGRLAGEEKTYGIFLQRVPRGDGVEIWKFASSTVADIPDLYAEFGYGRLESVFPPWFFDVQIFGIEVWFWFVAVILLGVTFPIAMLLTGALISLLRQFRPALAEEVAKFLTGPLRLLIWVLIARNLMTLTGGSLVVQAVGQAATFVVVALTWLGFRVLDLFTQRFSKRLEAGGLAGVTILLKPAKTLLKLVLLAGAVLLWLDNLGYEVTTLLAGLSISGVAVALASQKTLENAFGAVMLYTSQPVKVGDFCRVGDHMGTVEEIGLRATKIRTLERSLVTVPNGEFVTLHLDNLSARDRFWYHPTIRLRYGMTPDQIRYLIIEIRRMLHAHPRVLPDSGWVRFKEFGEYSLDLEVFAYMATSRYNESLEIAEDLNLRIMDLVAEAGSELAIPVQIQYNASGTTLDEQRARAAEAKVKEWRDQQTLYLPNFPPEKVAEMRGSLDYPPYGSPDRRLGRA